MKSKMSLSALVVFAMLLTFGGITCFAQRPETLSVKELYGRNQPYILDAPPSPRTGYRAMGGGSITEASPSDTAKFFTLSANTIYPEAGDRLVVRLIPLQNIAGTVSFGGRRFYQDQDGHVTVEYLNAPGMCDQGYCKDGLQIWQHPVVFGTEVSGFEQRGTYQLDVTMFDSTGHFIQQVFLNYHILAPSKNGRFGPYLDSAALDYTPNGPALVLRGSFPINDSFTVWVGNTGGGFWMINPEVRSGDGRITSLNLGISSNIDLPVDIVVLFPASRFASVLPRALVIPAQPTPLPSVKPRP